MAKPRNEVAEVQSIRVVVEAWGPQEHGVSCYYGNIAMRNVTITVGQVLLYVHDRQALESVADAWADASVMAEKMRLGKFTQVPESWPTDPALTAVSAHIHGKQTHRVMGVGAHASPNGYAHVVVTIGRVTFRVYGLLALDTYAEAMTEALKLSRVFGPAAKAFSSLREARNKQLP